MTSNLCWQRIN